MHSKWCCIHAFPQYFVSDLTHVHTSCTIRSNTFNHRMLKPKEKDKIRNVTWTGQTMNWQSRQRECHVFVQYFVSTTSWCQGERNLHCLLRCGASRRAECRTRSPHFQPSPKKPAWHSSQAKQGVAYSPSGTYYSLCAGAEIEKLGSLDTGRAVEEDVFRPFIYHC